MRTQKIVVDKYTLKAIVLFSNSTIIKLWLHQFSHTNELNHFCLLFFFHQRLKQCLCTVIAEFSLCKADYDRYGAESIFMMNQCGNFATDVCHSIARLCNWICLIFIQRVWKIRPKFLWITVQIFLSGSELLTFLSA